MKVVLFGSRGYLGQAFKLAYPDAICPETDIADEAAVAALLDSEKPDVIINCAGKTGRPNVDWCEDHKEETIRGNVTGPLILLNACSTRGIYFVQLSSGCIYAGDNEGRGFAETDAPNFAGSFYSRSKAWADEILSEFPVLLLRLRMPFDDSDNPRSLISKILKYPRVLDARNSLTYLPEFVAAAQLLIERRRTGIYNIVNPVPMSPFEIVSLYKKLVQPAHQFEHLSIQELPEVTKAARSNCTLSGAKLEAEGIHLTPAPELIERYFRSLATSSA